MTDTNYPAAHSMDTTWFAVDQVGQVGVFESWEQGAVPEGAFPNQDSSPLLEAEHLILALLRQRAVHDTRLAAVLPADDAEAEKVIWSLTSGPQADCLAADLGLWSYASHLSGTAGPYRRHSLVATPIELADLPDEIAALFAQARLPIRFAQTARFQPMEVLPSRVWSRSDWLGTDGQVRKADGSIEDNEAGDWGPLIQGWDDEAHERAAGTSCDDFDLAAAIFAAVERRLAVIEARANGVEQPQLHDEVDRILERRAAERDDLGADRG